MTDLEIEQAVTAAGGVWDGDHWKFEDADLHPFVRGLLAAERERWRATVEALLPMAEESITRPELDLVCLDARGLLKRA